MEETWEKLNKRLEMEEREPENFYLSINFILSLSRVFDLVSNFNFFNDMPSIFQDRLEAFDVVERRTKDMAEQLEARFGAVAHRGTDSGEPQRDTVTGITRNDSSVHDHL